MCHFSPSLKTSCLTSSLHRTRTLGTMSNVGVILFQPDRGHIRWGRCLDSSFRNRRRTGQEDQVQMRHHWQRLCQQREHTEYGSENGIHHRGHCMFDATCTQVDGSLEGSRRRGTGSEPTARLSCLPRIISPLTLRDSAPSPVRTSAHRPTIGGGLPSGTRGKMAP